MSIVISSGSFDFDSTGWTEVEGRKQKKKSLPQKNQKINSAQKNAGKGFKERQVKVGTNSPTDKTVAKVFSGNHKIAKDPKKDNAASNPQKAQKKSSPPAAAAAAAAKPVTLDSTAYSEEEIEGLFNATQQKEKEKIANAKSKDKVKEETGKGKTESKHNSAASPAAAAAVAAACGYVATVPKVVDLVPGLKKLEGYQIKALRFSQDSISSTTRLGLSIDTLIANMKRNGFRPDCPIHIVKMQGVIKEKSQMRHIVCLTSFDNRRLYAAKKVLDTLTTFALYAYEHDGGDTIADMEIINTVKGMQKKFNEQLTFLNSKSKERKWTYRPASVKDGTWAEAIVLRIKLGNTLPNSDQLYGYSEFPTIRNY